MMLLIVYLLSVNYIPVVSIVVLLYYIEINTAVIFRTKLNDMDGMQL